MLVLVSILMVAVPVLGTQRKVLMLDMIDKAIGQMQSASQSITAFLDKPSTIVRDIALYMGRAENLELGEVQRDFDAQIKGSPSLYCLYYAVARKAGVRRGP